MNLTAKDICSIIETSRAQGVERIVVSSNKLEVSFAKPIVETPLHAEPLKPVETNEEIKKPVLFTETQGDPATEKFRDDIAELVISDPTAFEEMLGRGELIDGESSHD